MATDDAAARVVLTYQRVSPKEARASLRAPQRDRVANQSHKELRVWRDDTGKFSIKAEFVSYASGEVKLRKEDGSEIEIVVQRLSEDDREFLRTKWLEKGMQAPF
jgi:hypothetical protein